MLTQEKDILRHLQTHKRGLSQADAAELFGCHRLGARIYDLRRKGFRIAAKDCHTTNRYGHLCRFARYYLEETK